MLSSTNSSWLLTKSVGLDLDTYKFLRFQIKFQMHSYKLNSRFIVTLCFRFFCFMLKFFRIMPSFRLSRNSYFSSEVNICFINSVLQLMHSLPLIRDYFFNQTFMSNVLRSYQLCSEVSRIFGFAGKRQITSAAQ